MGERHPYHVILIGCNNLAAVSYMLETMRLIFPDIHSPCFGSAFIVGAAVVHVNVWLVGAGYIHQMTVCNHRLDI